jgi:hypothetical protein
LEDPELSELLKPLASRRRGSWRLLPQEIAEVLTGELRRPLGVRTLTDDVATTWLIEATENELASAQRLSDDAKRRLLLAIADRDLWRRLPMHRFEDGGIGALDDRSFLATAYPIPAALRRSVRLVRTASDPTLAARQREFIDRWEPHTLIATALRENEPHRLMLAILEALGKIDENLSDDLRTELREMAWLDLPHGPTRPGDVLELDGETASEATSLFAGEGARVFVTVADLPADLRRPPGWRHVTDLFPSGSDALDGLGLLLVGYPCAVVVPAVPLPFDAALRLAARGIALPLRAWPLLAAVLRKHPTEEVERHLLPSLTGDLSAESLVDVLKALAVHDKGSSASDPDARVLFAFYLRAALRHAQRAVILEAIELPNRAGGWTSATRIAAKAQGVAATAVLHPDFVELFEQDGQGVVPDPGVAREVHGLPDPAGAAEVLCEYFGPWRHVVPLAPVGAFLALLGEDPAIQELAEDFLREDQRDLTATAMRLCRRGLSAIFAGATDSASQLPKARRSNSQP